MKRDAFVRVILLKNKHTKFQTKMVKTITKATPFGTAHNSESYGPRYFRRYATFE